MFRKTSALFSLTLFVLCLASSAHALRIGLDDRNGQTAAAQLGQGAEFDDLRALIDQDHDLVLVSSFDAASLAAANIDALYLLHPYVQSGGDYSASELSGIQGFVNGGGGLVMHAEGGAGSELSGATNWSALAAVFGVSFAATATEDDGHEILLFNAHPVTAGLGPLPGSGFCLDFQRRLSIGAPSVDLTQLGAPLTPQDDALAAFTGGPGQGNVVIVSDTSGFKDPGVSFDTDISQCGNELLAENILDFVTTENPIPEPGTFALFGLGLLGLGLRRVRRKAPLVLGITLALGLAAPEPAGAVCVGTPTQCTLGQFGQPFSQPTLLDIETPERCLEDTEGELRCKVTAGTLVVLEDDRFLYWNALEGTENVEVTLVSEFGFVSANDQSRLLTLAANDAPTWSQPDPVDGGANPDGNDDGIGPCNGTPNEGANGALFCSDQVMLHDGRVLAAGGTDYYNDACIDTEFPEGTQNIVPFPVGSVELEGLKNARIFDPADDTWSQTDSMEYGRWYPTAVSLSDGDVFVASGVTRLVKPVYPEAPFNSGRNVVQTETYDTACGTWSNNGFLGERTLPLFPRLHLLPNGHVYYNAGGQAFNPFGQAYDQALWNVISTYNPASQAWIDHGIAGFPLQLDDVGFDALVTSLNPTNPDGPSDLLQDLAGQLLNNPQAFADEFNAIALALIEQILGIDLTDPDQVIAVTGAGFRGSTFSVMLPLVPDGNGAYSKAEFLTSGGTQSAIVNPSPGGYVATALSRIDTMDLSDPNTAYSSRLTGSLNQPRWYGSGTLLPNGQVLVTSGADRDHVQTPGSEIAVIVAELFDPDTETWSLAAVQNRQRTYHNTAALMPDGRVLVGGHAPITNSYMAYQDLGDPFAPNNGRDPSFEIYSPPYVFSTQRPVLADVSDQEGEPADETGYGDELNVQLSNVTPGNPVSFWLMRRTATTHLVDGDQRAVELPIQGSFGSFYTLNVPNDPDVLPPGKYLLFARQETALEGIVPSKGFGLSIGPGVVGACP